MKKFWPIITIIIVILIGGGFYYFQYVRILPNSAATYYKIFNKNEILSGNEEKATIVDQKLDARLKKYHKTFAQIAGTTDEKKLKALFYMNFVHFFGVYGKRELSELSLKEILWGSQYFHCGTNTTLLAMLLEKAGYEYRTVSINNSTHGMVEVKFDGKWNLLDPTSNLWFDKSTEELAGGAPHTVKEFFMQAEDESNTKAREHMTVDGIKCDLFCLKDQMFSIGDKFYVTVDKYNYIDLSKYQY